MQQPKSYSLFKETSPLLSRVIGQLFDDEPIRHRQHTDVTLLKPQPAAQRRQFLRQAIDRHYRVLLQVVPAGSDGFPENIRGYVKKLGQQKFLIYNHNLIYAVSFDQIRYIIHQD